MIELHVEDGIGSITLARPPVNALDTEMLGRLEAIVDEADGRADVRCLVIRSRAPKAFCAGADIQMIDAFADDHDGMIDFVARLQQLYERIETSPLPSIAAISGTATGGGLELALACDLRIAGNDVVIGMPEVAIGLFPGAGGTQRLTALAGRGTSMRMILTGELVTGAQAAELGIVQWALPVSEVEIATKDIAQGLSDTPAATLAAAKECIGRARSREGFEDELRLTRSLLGTPETSQLIRKFVQAHGKKERT